MRNKMLPMMLVFVIALLSFSAVAAQDATATPTPGGENVEVLNTLEDITADSASYYGQQVTVEGVVEEFLNTRVFVLGEGATLDDDKVLVINTSNNELPLNISRDQHVRLTGTIYPAIQDGGIDQISSGAPTTAMTATPDTMAETVMPMEVTPMATEDMMTTPMATDDMSMMETPTDATSMMNDMTNMSENALDWTTMVLPDGYADYTILVLSSLDNTVTFIQQQ